MTTMMLMILLIIELLMMLLFDVVMVRTTQSELVTLKIHVETSLLHPDFGLILEQILIFLWLTLILP